LKARAEVAEARHTFDVRRYESGAMLELFIDAELSSGKAAVWGLEVSWNDSCWTIEHFVRANDQHGQYSVHEFPTQEANVLQEALAHLVQATDDLIASALGDDIAGY
jgi:hypothetical protein